MRAITREIASSFANALCATPPEPPIDVALARRQHAAYREALAGLGVEVIVLPADERFPDGCFVEDTAVVVGDLALITRPGAPSRRGEVDAVAAALAGHLELARMVAPATLDGGDCLRLGRTIYVGRSLRTDDAGIAALRALAARRGVEVVAVPMAPEVLHLKCVCARLADDTVLVADGALDAAIFAGARVVRAPAGESYAANALAIGEAVLVSDGYPGTAVAIDAAGFRVIPLPTSEVRKADGALTCLSILFASVTA
jgi:dimethylargininase